MQELSIASGGGKQALIATKAEVEEFEAQYPAPWGASQFHEVTTSEGLHLPIVVRPALPVPFDSIPPGEVLIRTDSRGQQDVCIRLNGMLEEWNTVYLSGNFAGNLCYTAPTALVVKLNLNAILEQHVQQHSHTGAES